MGPFCWSFKASEVVLMLSCGYLQQREMLLLDPADQVAVGLEHRRDRRHLLFRLDEGVDALRQCRLDRRPNPTQPRAGGLMFLTRLIVREILNILLRYPV